MAVDVEININDKEVRALLELAIKQSCELIGQAAVRHASDRTICPVDTGRLSNSMTYATKEHNATMSYADDSGKPYTVSLSEVASEGEVIFGTNVEYGLIQEARKHMVRKAAGDHTNEYKEILQNRLASAFQ